MHLPLLRECVVSFISRNRPINGDSFRFPPGNSFAQRKCTTKLLYGSSFSFLTDEDMKKSEF